MKKKIVKKTNCKTVNIDGDFLLDFHKTKILALC